MSDVARVLQAASAGDPRTAADLLPSVYDGLKRFAAPRLVVERPGQTLQPRVHEAWLKISGSAAHSWQGRQPFFAAAAESMRRIRVDYPRRLMAAGNMNEVKQ